MAIIVLDAGHGMNTAGKRCMKSIDPNETREWFLNQRIASEVERRLQKYKDVTTIRVDDPTGKTDVSLNTRTKTANNAKADLYISFHHDAGAGGTAAGGISVFTYDDRAALHDIAHKVYDALIAAGGLTGRSNPVKTEDFHVLRETKMNAVLVEHGFMDSTKDTPVILTNEYAMKMADGWMNFLASYFNLVPIDAEPAPAPTPEPVAPAEPEKKPEEPKSANGLPYLVKITTSALNIRKEPGTDSAITGVIRDKGVYTIVEEHNHNGYMWGKLKSGKGWISLKYTKKLEK